MARFDMSEPELRAYRPQIAEPSDFDAFWTATIAEARAHGAEATVEPIAAPFAGISVFRVRFPGFGGHPIGAWLLVPDGAVAAPAVAVFQGYGGARGLPHEWLPWVSAGYVTLAVDTRGHGAGRSAGPGDGTPDPVGSTPAVPGMMTRGITDPADYYYRRVFTDAVRAVDFLLTRAEVDPARIAVAGMSQGGGIALAAAGLHSGVAACMSDVPFLCHFERAVGLTDMDPYGEIVRYLRVHREDADAVFHTLSYMDGVSFAARASAPALFSVALHDVICPPSTVFAAFNAYGTGSGIANATPKDITVYPFNGHEGGGADHWPKQVAFADAVFGISR